MKSNDPLHGVTLEQLLRELVDRHGWAGLGRRINIRCFHYQPSLTSSLRFLRRTPWARAKVEELYREHRLARPPPPAVAPPGGPPHGPAYSTAAPPSAGPTSCRGAPPSSEQA